MLRLRRTLPTIYAYVGGITLSYTDPLGLCGSDSGDGGVLSDFLKSRAKSFGKDEIEKKSATKTTRATAASCANVFTLPNLWLVEVLLAPDAL